MPSSVHDTAIAITNSQLLWLSKPSQQSAIDEGDTHVALLLPAELLAPDSGRGQAIVFTCLPTAKSTRFQLIIPNSWSHRWPWVSSTGCKKEPWLWESYRKEEGR